LSLTYLLRHLATYSQTQDQHRACTKNVWSSGPPCVIQQSTGKMLTAFHLFGVDKLSSEQLYRMCAGRTIW